MFILLIAFLLGPTEGVVVCVLKETIRITASTSGGVGELANMIVTTSYILLPAIVYQQHKGLKNVIFALIAGCLLGTGMSLLANRFVNFPLYEVFLGMPAKQAFQALWGFILAFNLIKTVAISVLTMLLYKRLSNFLKKLKI